MSGGSGTAVKRRGRSKRTYDSSTVETIDYKVQKAEAEQRRQRKNLTLFKHPLTCIYLFSLSCKDYGIELIRQLINNKLLMLIFVILGIIIVIQWIIPASFIARELFPVYVEIEWILWWFLLGVLSSIGFGTGMHSGLLFLFPFIGEVCMVAATCHSMQFKTYGVNAFHCQRIHAETESTVTFAGLFLKVVWPCFLWGAGTACGEIPPYAVALATKKAGKMDEFSEMQHELENEFKSKPRNFFVRMKLWMIQFLERYGFWAVLAFAAWPNMAFDMCGIACGHFEMSFWTFFGATFIGKALIKVNTQAIFFLCIFNETTLNSFIDWIEHIGLPWIANEAQAFFETQRTKFSSKSGGDSHGEDAAVEPQNMPLLSRVWMYFVTGLILVFIASMIQSFAQQKQRELDGKANEKLKKSLQQSR